MRKIINICVILLISLSGYAQSAEGRYSSRMTQDGTLFFIMPQKLGRCEGLRNFEYDMTLLNWSDSMTINFTFESPMMVKPEDLKIISDSCVFECNSYKLLFTDVKKERYEIRVTSKYPVSVFESILKTLTPPVFSFSQDGVVRTASYKESSWRKERKKFNDIFQIYLYSK